ncbi:hypothetical protein C8R45DRAFT_1094994 [Mycena sanguinolenta]|nr:hypothetical protein C8R45DRAFT_1094994 [Mycena sanguinolenta]
MQDTDGRDNYDQTKTPSPPPPSTMMLVQKQPLFSMSFAQKQPLYSLAQSPQQFIHHRRNPSAPVVHVQPTRTPGLLSLSKPPRQAKASPRPKPAVATQRSPKPAPAQAVERGRQQANHNNSHNSSNSPSINTSHNKRRSASQAAPARRRQPSPDPFASAAPPPNHNKRRHPNATNPIPVPPPLPVHAQNLSRSDPVLSHMPRRRQPQRTTTLDSATFAPASSAFDEFPICDDMTEAGSRPSTPSPPSPTTARRPKPALHLSEPRTPTRKSRLPDPPRTAPLSNISPGSFPFPPAAPATTPSPHASPKRRADRRAKHLSEGVALPTLFPFVFPKEEQDFSHATLEPRSRSTERHSSEPPNPNTKFASSMFQNSPSPEELPPPLFV